ncbi:MAG: mechanosensitive ion channel [Rubripirellula sp.]|nr:mechanosensitive ion channel [Rubripirellula sp.]
MLGSQAANQLNKAVLHIRRAALLVLFLPFSLADAQVPIPPTALAPQQPVSNGKPTAEPTQQSAVPANEELTTLRNGITQSQLTEEEKAALLATVARTQSALASAAEFDRSAQDFKALLDSLPHRTEQAKQKLADPEEPQAGLQVEDTLEALEAILPQLTSQLATAKSDLARIESAAAVSIKRRQEIEVNIPLVQEQLTKVRDQLESKPAAEPTLADQVRREDREATANQLANQLISLQNEAALIDAESTADISQFERDAQIRTVASLQQQIETVEATLASKRAEDAADRVETAESELEGLHPALQPIGELSQQYAADNQKIASLISEVDRDLKRQDDKQDEVKRDFQEAKTLVETVGLMEAVGLKLRSLKSNLPDVREYELRLRNRQPVINDAQYSLIELKNRRNARVEQVIQTLLNSAQPPVTLVERDALADEAKRLLENQRTEYLNPLIRSQNTYFNKLVALSTTEQQIIKVAEESSDYVNQRILWVRSTRPLFAEPVPNSSDWWFFLPGATDNVTPKLLDDLKRRWIRWTLSLLSLLVLFRWRFRLRDRINELGLQVSRGSFIDFMPTIHSAMMTMATAGPVTLVLAFVGYRMRLVAGIDPATLAISNALILGAMTYFPLEVLRQACRPNGLAVAHFGYDEKSIALIRQWLHRLMWWLLPAVILISFLAGGRTGFGSDVLERYCFLLATLALAFQLARLFHPQRGLPSQYLQLHPAGWANRMTLLWYPGIVCIPLAMGLLATLGYYFTATQLTWRIYQTIVLVLVATLVVSLLTRWALLRRRELMIADARAQREQQALNDESASDLPAAPSEDAAAELRVQMSQTRRLLAALMIGAVFAGLWMIWSDVLTARAQMEAHPLWKSTTTATEMKIDPNGEAITLTKTVVDNVTLADLVFALMVGAITILATRNVPGLLEFAVLKKLPIDSSSRYAITAISSYSIALVGLIVAGRAIGLHWEQVQWMATALTFGLAFGLQEMFANFVAGIIILFEQPVRVGDIVEIDGITGVVTKIRIRATTITDWNRKDYIVPNKEFITGKILNWTRTDDVSRIVVPVGIAYGSETEKARELLLQSARKNEFVLKDPGPVATFEGFGDNSLNFVLRCFVGTPSVRLSATHDLYTAIDTAFRDAEIEISFPQQDIYLRSVPKSMSEFLSKKEPR